MHQVNPLGVRSYRESRAVLSLLVVSMVEISTSKIIN